MNSLVRRFFQNPGLFADTVSYKCQPNGSWFFHEEFNKTWVNYTSCVNTADLSVSPATPQQHWL